MHLFILKPHDNFLVTDPWDPRYDKVYAQIVRAGNESLAREMSTLNCGDEGANAWLDSEFSSCDIISAEGEAGFIVRDYCGVS